MNIAIAISPIIKVLGLDRDERALVMCHKIHLELLGQCECVWLQLYSSTPACALWVVVKHGVPAD